MAEFYGQLDLYKLIKKLNFIFFMSYINKNLNITPL